jgi:transcriptional regulator with XRE-family HTH domain
MPNPEKYIPERRTDRNEVGPTIAKIRKAIGLTQEDLAGRAASVGWLISRDVVKRIERREREVTDIELKYLARALRVPVGSLLD